MTRKQRSRFVGVGLAAFGGAAAVWLGGTGTGHSVEGVRSPAGLLGAAASAGTEARPAESRLATTVVGHEVLAQLDALFANAAPGSAAQFRVKEERDGLVLRLTGQLDYLGAVFANATPGSPAQFRAREEADSLGDHLRAVARG